MHPSVGGRAWKKVETKTEQGCLFFDSSTEFSQSPTAPSIIQLPGNRPQPFAPFPAPFSLAPCRPPSASPLWRSEEFYSRCHTQTLTQKTHAYIHVGCSKTMHTDTHMHKSHMRVCTQTHMFLQCPVDPHLDPHSLASVSITASRLADFDEPVCQPVCLSIFKCEGKSTPWALEIK